MKRGEIWTVSGGGYAGKPRPAVIIQDDRFDETLSITVCIFTSNETDAPFFRRLIDPSEQNGLHAPSRLMVDKITTVPKHQIGRHLGRLEDDNLAWLNRTILVFLGLARPGAARRDMPTA